MRNAKRLCELGAFLLLLLMSALFTPPGKAQNQNQDRLKQMQERAAASASALASILQDREQSLRKRVEQFYVDLQLGHWEQAEAYFSKDSRESFRKQAKRSPLGFQVGSIKLDPNGQEATVVVQTQASTRFSTTPLTLPQTTHWRWVDGVWYVAVPNQENASKSLFDSPASHNPSPAEELKFKGHRYSLGKIEPGQIKVARFPFTNVTDHVVSLSEVLTGCECLRLKTEKREYKPRESGELAIEFDPAGFEREYMQTIVVKTDPGDLTTYLTIGAYVIPRELQGPKPAPKEKPGS